MSTGRFSLMSTTQLAGRINATLASDRDCVIAVSGVEGEGKSTYSMEQAMKINGPKFMLKRHFIYSPYEVRDRIRQMHGEAVTIDEGMEAFYKRNWNTQNNKLLNMIFSMCRKQNLAVLINIPNFWDLDPYYRNHRIKLWIFVVVRGRAVMFAPDPNPFAEDRWHRYENWKIISKKVKSSWESPEAILAALRRSPNYVADITFSDMLPEVKKEYLVLKNKNFEEFEERNREGGGPGAKVEQRYRVRYMNLLKSLHYKQKIPLTKIAVMAGLNQSYTYALFRTLEAKGETAIEKEKESEDDSELEADMLIEGTRKKISETESEPTKNAFKKTKLVNGEEMIDETADREVFSEEKDTNNFSVSKPRKSSKNLNWFEETMSS